MSVKMDRQGARTPADLERKYNFKKKFDKTQKTAKEAKKNSSEIEGLSLKVAALEEELNGKNGVKAQLERKIEADDDRKVDLAGTFTGDISSGSVCEYTDETNETARFRLLHFKDNISGKDFILYACGVRYVDGTFAFKSLMVEEAETTEESK